MEVGGFKEVAGLEKWPPEQGQLHLFKEEASTVLCVFTDRKSDKFWRRYGYSKGVHMHVISEKEERLEILDVASDLRHLLKNFERYRQENRKTGRHRP